MPSYAKSQLVRGINAMCRECNDVRGAWTAENDCTSDACQMYPFRPGNGPGHAEPMKTAARNTDGLRRARGSKPKTHEIPAGR